MTQTARQRFRDRGGKKRGRGAREGVKRLLSLLQQKKNEKNVPQNLVGHESDSTPTYLGVPKTQNTENKQQRFANFTDPRRYGNKNKKRRRRLVHHNSGKRIEFPTEDMPKMTNKQTNQ